LEGVLSSVWRSLAVCIPIVGFIGCSASAASADITKLIAWSTVQLKSGKSEVWVANADGSNAHKLANGFDPRISPDGRWIAYQNTVRDRDLVYVVPSTGGTPRRLTPPRPEYADYSFAWAADSTRVVVGGVAEQPLVRVLDPATGSIVRTVRGISASELQTVPGSEAVTAAALDKKGRARNLLMLNLADGNKRTLARLRKGEIEYLAVSGSEAAFSISKPRRTNSTGIFLESGELRTVDLASGAQRVLGNGMQPIGYTLDGRLLVTDSDCRSTKRSASCSFHVSTYAPASSTPTNAVPLGIFDYRRLKGPRKRSRRRRGEIGNGLPFVINMDFFWPAAVSSGGSLLLGQDIDFRVRGYEALARLFAALFRAPIAKISLTGQPPQPIAPGARGFLPTWNL
jgi:hypothetical protein